MSVVQHGNEMIDVRPHVERVLRRLKTIRPDKFEGFLAAFVIIFEGGGTGYNLRRLGTPMDEGGRRMTVETWDMLSERGRRDPVKACDELILQICRGIYREYHARRIEKSAQAASAFGRPALVRLTTLPGSDCASARAAAGTIIPWEEAPALPLAGCTKARPYCACSWMGPLPRAEADAWLASRS